MNRALFLISMVLVLLSGCGSKSDAPTYKAADQFILYSIDGRDSRFAPPADIEAFRGIAVLGKTAIDDPKKRAELMSALYGGIDKNDDTIADCFIPRHGIHIVQGEQIIDYLICFECLQVKIYRGDKRSSELTSESPRKVFNQYLKDAGLPLAP
ncbi:MAG: hypothetical protein IH984_16130 [Planctomycetes bacterium]|nr:hypothetical protein [Planctomycetota bacterium]